MREVLDSRHKIGLRLDVLPIVRDKLEVGRLYVRKTVAKWRQKVRQYSARRQVQREMVKRAHSQINKTKLLPETVRSSAREPPREDH